MNRSSNHALPAPIAAPVAIAPSSRARCVGTRRTIQCTSKAATIHPLVIQSEVPAARRVRRDATASRMAVRPYIASQPPSTTSSVPVMYEASSEATKSTA
jgi:hypothetical protein